MDLLIQTPQFNTKALRVGQPIMVRSETHDITSLPFKQNVFALVRSVKPLVLAGTYINDKGETKEFHVDNITVSRGWVEISEMTVKLNEEAK